MRLKWLLVLLVSISLFSYEDNDLDGVDDSIDECLDTPFMDIVDRSGCSVKSLISPHHFDIIVGLSLATSEINATTNFSTTTTSFQADYFYKNYSATLSSSYNDSKTSSEMGNTKVAFGYELLPFENIVIDVAAGAILPTSPSDTNTTDNIDYTFSLSFSYAIADTTLFANYAFVAVEDVSDYFEYQNSSSFSLGLGNKITKDSYLSLSYSTTQSRYKGEDNYEDVTLYGKYLLTESWFMMGSYFYGVGSTNESGFGMRLGYYW